jgi:hypothetical protein
MSMSSPQSVEEEEGLLTNNALFAYRCRGSLGPVGPAWATRIERKRKRVREKFPSQFVNSRLTKEGKGREGGREGGRGRARGGRARGGREGRREEEFQVNIPSRSVFNVDHRVPTAHPIPHFVS